MKTQGRIDRAGAIHFGDAGLHIWEEGIAVARATGGFKGVEAWERQFKRDVFARIVQTLRRIGWTCTMPAIDPHAVKHYGGDVARHSAESKRFCTKGDLKADLNISGRCIDFKMFQSINCPTRPDHEGRYEHNKEACMPYVLRLEMERTRRRIRDYLCNVFTGYSFEEKHRHLHIKPLKFTALERIQQFYDESVHFKGDWAAELAKPHSQTVYNRKSADGVLLEHGQRVWFFDTKGRCGEGRAYYADGMWWVAYGRYGLTKMNASELHAACPENPRVKRNARLRRKCLERELARVVKAMDFDRAKVLRDVLFPPGTGPLFHVRVKKDGLLYGPNSSGYTHDSVRAGKYTKHEADRIVRGSSELEAVEVSA